MKPFAVGGATEFHCGVHSNNNINYSVPITRSMNMNFSLQKRLISAWSDLASSKYLSLHTADLSRVKGSIIDELVNRLAFGAYSIVFVKKKNQTKPSNRCDFYAFSVVKTCIQSFPHGITIPSFSHTWS